MNICVLSASPKGSYSVTYQTVRYLALRFPEDRFETLHIGARIRAAEKELSPFTQQLQGADLILFCYPVYTFMAPYQLHRFIELLKEAGVRLDGKSCAQITTSKHFYDTTAHAYVRENAEDLGLCYLGGLSADMDDLLSERGREEAEAFWRLVHFRKENGLFDAPKAAPVSEIRPYIPLGRKSEKTEAGEIVIVANLEKGDTELAAMIEDFRDIYPAKSRVVNLVEYPFKGGCLGCFRCATDGKCVYKDGFDSFLREEIQSGSAIVYAFRVKDHSMGARMKLYDDRQFCNGHRTVTAGMPMGYIVAGDIEREENLRTVIAGRSEVGGNFLCGVATDAAGVAALAKTLSYALKEKLTQPANFLGVGGMKIFRDLIYLMQGMMRADHKFYKAHGLYKDFPQKKKTTILKMKLVGLLISNEKIRRKMGNKMNEGMLMPYNKLFKKLENESKGK